MAFIIASHGNVILYLAPMLFVTSSAREYTGLLHIFPTNPKKLLMIIANTAIAAV